MILVPDDPESAKKLWEEENVKSIAPLDIALGVSKVPFKMTVDLMLRCAFWAQKSESYRDAEETMCEELHFNVNDTTIRQVANFIGQLVFENELRKTDELFRLYDAGKLTYGRPKKGVLYIEADGSAINTRHTSTEGTSWRENKLAIIFSSKDVTSHIEKNGKIKHTIHNRDYVTYLGDVEGFKRLLFTHAVSYGYGRYEETVVVSDGSAWIDNMGEELFPDAQRILDLYHLKENVYSYAKEKFRYVEEQYRPWAEKKCQQLEDGEWENVLSDLNPNEKYINSVDLYHYITENKKAINYPEYKRKGYFIGSGAIESGHKEVVQDRMKRAGMRWEPETAQYLLTLRALKKSGRWESDVVAYIHDYFGVK